MKSIYKILKKLPNIVKVEKCDNPGIFKERYFLYFSQPLDHNDLSAGNFIQRVEFGFNNLRALNIFLTTGYETFDTVSLTGLRFYNIELASHYKANYISPDYRYFGKSFPQNFKLKDPKSYKYLTVKNAADDFHNLYKIFKTFLKNKWIQTGHSKGGVTTHLQAAYYPKDADLYVSYVSTKLFDRHYKGFIENVYFNIGKDVKINNKLIDLKAYRKELCDIQVFLLENKKYFIRKLKCFAHKNKMKYSNFVRKNKKLFFDYLIIDLGLVFWQYSYLGDKYEKICRLNRILNKKQKLIAVFEWFKTQSFNVYAINNQWMYPYLVQTYKETGMFEYNFDPLIKTIIKYSDSYKTKQEVYKLLGFKQSKLEKLEENLVFNNILNKQILDYFQEFDNSQHNVEKELYEHSKVPIIMIWGTADTWYQMRINSNNKLKKSKKIIEIHQKGISHVAKIATLSKNKQTKVWKLINKILKIKKKV